MSRRYFFSHHAGLADGGWAFGNCDAALPAPIRSYEDVQRVAGEIRAKNPGTTTVVILSWQRFEDPE